MEKARHAVEAIAASDRWLGKATIVRRERNRIYTVRKRCWKTILYIGISYRVDGELALL